MDCMFLSMVEVRPENVEGRGCARRNSQQRKSAVWYQFHENTIKCKRYLIESYLTMVLKSIMKSGLSSFQDVFHSKVRVMSQRLNHVLITKKILISEPTGPESPRLNHSIWHCRKFRSNTNTRIIAFICGKDGGLKWMKSSSYMIYLYEHQFDWMFIIVPFWLVWYTFD